MNRKYCSQRPQFLQAVRSTAVLLVLLFLSGGCMRFRPLREPTTSRTEATRRPFVTTVRRTSTATRTETAESQTLPATAVPTTTAPAATETPEQTTGEVTTATPETTSTSTEEPTTNTTEEPTTSTTEEPTTSTTPEATTTNDPPPLWEWDGNPVPEPAMPDSETLLESVRLFTSARLNLRTGPGTGHGIILTTPMDVELDADEYINQDGWFPVRYNGQDGYVSEDFVEYFIFGHVPADRHWYTIREMDLLDENDQVLAQLPFNTRVEPQMRNRGTGRYRVTVGGQEGYVHEAQLSFTLHETGAGWQAVPIQPEQLYGNWHRETLDVFAPSSIYGLLEILHLNEKGEFRFAIGPLLSEWSDISGNWSLAGGRLILEVKESSTFDQVQAENYSLEFAVFLSEDGQNLQLRTVKEGGAIDWDTGMPDCLIRQ